MQPPTLLMSTIFLAGFCCPIATQGTATANSTTHITVAPRIGSTTCEQDIIWKTPVLRPESEDFVSPAEEIELRKRAPPAGVYVCENKNWLGKCAWIALQDRVCMDFPWDAGTSIGPPGGWQCKFYYRSPCMGTEFTDGKLTYPGTPNLGALYNNYKKPTSMKCRRCPQESPCINNNAPVWAETIYKSGYMGKDGTCTWWEGGKTHKSTCLGFNG